MNYKAKIHTESIFSYLSNDCILSKHLYIHKRKFTHLCSRYSCKYPLVIAPQSNEIRFENI